ncbi:MAG: hypothetical protein P1U89_04150 [Verrucomicrobiales bacterium]|nr:hypothetical protein [Verrucomicrobiales bacterium]
MITIANFNTLEEAQQAQRMMEREGVESFIPDEISIGLVSPLFSSNSGVRLQVPEESEADAIRVLNQIFSIAD